MTIQELEDKIGNCIRTFLNESANYVNEAWSVSDSIEENMEIVYNAIGNDIGNARRTQINSNIQAFDNIVEITVFGSKRMPLHYVCYNCDSELTLKTFYNDLYARNGFNEEEDYLEITIYLVNGDIIEDYSNPNIKHELEHILQSIKGKENNPNYKELMDSAYHFASKILGSTYDGDDDNKYSENDIVVAKLIYYSNSHEQDAFMNEYHDELKRNVIRLYRKDTTIHSILNEYIECIDYFNSHLNDRNFLNAVNKYRLFGYTIKNFQIMLDKQLHRFKKKMNNVEKHFKNNKRHGEFRS